MGEKAKRTISRLWTEGETVVFPPFSFFFRFDFFPSLGVSEAKLEKCYRNSLLYFFFHFLCNYCYYYREQQ